ncbi:MAG: hypothetical protein QF732_08780 [Nitrospinaceae bacterium]|jgi:uncharacterized protein YukE|nr:hypothetical protein [Nitrospinaceae bacterium]|tara:strand:- start:109 stop:2685 length:2577 start_codon:yes stop_codon:yes gene_type:complete
MISTLQPLLAPVKGTPDLLVYINPQNPGELLVFLGMALLERVAHARDDFAFKMLLARLYNAGMNVASLVLCFGVAHTTLRRWGLSLLSGDMDQINRTFSGQGAERKITPEIDFYVRDRFRELHGSCRAYNKKIREEVKKYFKIEVSAERLRWIFVEEREKAEEMQEAQMAQAVESESQEVEGKVECEDRTEEEQSVERANSWDTEKDGNDREELEENNYPPDSELGADNAVDRPIENDSAVSSPNYSLCKGEMFYGTKSISKWPRLVHHAGIVLFSPWMDLVIGDMSKDRHIIGQWFTQILLGAVNHEQSKRLSFSSLEFLIGPSVSSLNHQRRLLKEICGRQPTLELLERNSRLVDLSAQNIFYYDPHTKEYTGFLKILKGWCGAKGRVSKVINLDFIHTLNGSPCFVQHYDCFYDLRERFFLCTAAFRRIMPDKQRSLTWVVDRGIYSLAVLRRIVGMGDNIITWEKGYSRDGWGPDARSETFVCFRARNNSTDLRTYEFCYQESRWVRDTRFRRLVVRARNPNGNEIEVAILASDQAQEAQKIIEVIFSRWIQENDFSYLIEHFGIDELTTRGYQSYSSVAEELNDRQIRSREYRELVKNKQKLEAAISRLLLKQKKHESKIKKKRREGESKLKSVQQECEDLESRLERYSRWETEKAHQKSYKQLKAKSKKCKKMLETLGKKLGKEEETGGQKRQEMETEINTKTLELEKVEQCMMETVAEESRLQALIDEQYIRLEMRGKAFMDVIRLSCRNIFYCLMDVFRPLYENYRDDHVVLRELTRSIGIVEKREGMIRIQLMPAIEFQPKVKEVVVEFLEIMSIRINEYFSDKWLPIQIQLLEDQSVLFGKTGRDKKS